MVWNRLRALLTPQPKPCHALDVYLLGSRAYVPLIGEVRGSGLLSDAGPVVTCDIAVDAIAQALWDTAQKGHPQIPPPDLDSPEASNPVLRAMGVRSWREAARKGAMSCMLMWEARGVRIAVSPPGRLGEPQEFCDEATSLVPADTPMDELAEIILREWHRRHS